MSAFRRIAGMLPLALILAIAIGLIASAVDGQTAAERSGTTSSERSFDIPSVTCKTRLQVIPAKENPGHVSPETRENAAIVGPLMFIGAKSWADEELRPNDNGKALAKSPLLLKKGPPVTVAVSSPTGNFLELRVGLDQRGPQGGYEAHGPSLLVKPCDPNAKVAGRRVGKRTFYPGGFRLEPDTCVDVTVQVKGETETHQTSFGIGRDDCAP